MTRRSGFAPVEGGLIYYEAVGAGPAVVFVHGFSLDLRMWDSQVEHFLPGHTVVRYDIRGFGRSPAPIGKYSNAADLNALLDCLEVKRAGVCGLSMGGTIGMEFAVRYPARVTALVAVDAAGNSLLLKGDEQGRANDLAIRRLLASIRKAGKSDGVPHAKRLWLESPLFKVERSLPGVYSSLKEMVEDYSGWHWLNPSPYLPFEPDPSDRYPDMDVPVLAIVGERDLPVFHSIARGIGHAVPGARLHTIEGAGHMANMCAPAEFNRVVLDFYDQHL